MLTQVALFLATRLGRMVFGGGVLVALVVSFAAHQRSVGRDQMAAIRDEQNAAAVSVAKKGASKSRSGQSGRVLDPYVRAPE